MVELYVIDVGRIADRCFFHCRPVAQLKGYLVGRLEVQLKGYHVDQHLGRKS